MHYLQVTGSFLTPGRLNVSRGALRCHTVCHKLEEVRSQQGCSGNEHVILQACIASAYGMVPTVSTEKMMLVGTDELSAKHVEYFQPVI